MPLGHVSVPVKDIKASTGFYLAALAPLGYTVFKDIKDICVGFAPKNSAPDFWFHKCPDLKEGGIAPPKTHVAFQVKSQKTVHAFHEAALKAGAKCNGRPGERPQYVKGYYAAFVLDPDGNNIECMCWQPLWLTALQNAPLALGALAVGVAWWAGRNGWMVS